MPLFRQQDASGLVLPVETRTTAIDGDYVFMIDASTNIPYRITKANLLAGLSSGGSGGSNVSLNYVSDGDTNGLFYYLGSSKKTTAWVNPSGGGVIISASSTESGVLSSLTDRASSEWFSNINANNWVQFQLVSCKLQCSKYSIKTRANNVDYYPRNWQLQGSNDGTTWDVIDSQVNNTALNSVSQWLTLSVTSTTAYSYFRILQNGNDSSGTGYLCLGEVELYGTYSPQ
ncbi:MAG: discoidin domain-containing protein [Nostoc sp.]|uniref:discoidin domain-containing protein n=1 Tax=Nostoc sp. TaxID=1180 RepID=UPI002FF8E882